MKTQTLMETKPLSEDQSLRQIVVKARSIFPDSHVKVSKEYYGSQYAETTLDVEYHLYISGACIEQFRELNGMLWYAHELFLEHDPDYKSIWAGRQY